jgi:hypothetical protein
MVSSCFGRIVRMEQKFLFLVRETNREDIMDRITRCPKCGKRLTLVVTISGRSDLQCISCDDPAVKWAEGPPTTLEKPAVTEHVETTPHASS